MIKRESVPHISAFGELENRFSLALNFYEKVDVC